MFEIIKKLIKSIKSMITQDNIAAAQIAQIFGSELLRVQQSVSDSQTQPDIVKLNPKQFLVGQAQFANARRMEEQQALQRLNREAEMLYPIPQQDIPPSPPPSPPPLQPPVAASPQASSPSSVAAFPSATPQQNADVLTMIAIFLERIATKLESVDLKPKRKTIKRKTKNKKLTLLNENNV